MICPGDKPRRGVIGCWCNVIGRVCLSRYLHWIARLFWLGAKAGAFVLFFLWAFGIPGVFVAKQLQPYVHPYELSLQRLTWSPLRGIIAHRVQIEEPVLGTNEVLYADSWVFRPSYRRLLHGELHTSQIGLKNARILFPVTNTNRGDIVGNMWIANIDGTVNLRDDGTFIAMSGTTEIGSQCTINGFIRKSKRPEADSSSVAWLKQIYRIHDALNRTPEWIVKLREEMRSVVFAQSPKALLSFEIDRDNSAENSGRLQFQSPPFSYAGETFDRLEMDVSARGRIVDIQHVLLAQGDHVFTVKGSYDYAADAFEAHIRNDLPMNAIAAFFPAKWRGKLDLLGVKFSGNALAEGWMGPCRLDEVPLNWSGWISVDNASVDDLNVDRAFATIKAQNRVITVEDGVVEGGRGIGHGAVSFSVTSDLAGGNTSCDLDVGIDLQQLKPILPHTLKNVADMFAIREKPVRFSGSFVIPHDDPDLTVVTGNIIATNAQFRGVDITGLNTHLTYTNHSVILNPLLATCQTGMISGSLDLDLRRQLYGIDLEITTNPKSAAPMVGPTFPRHLSYYSFSDDVFVKVKGVVDTKTDMKTDLDVYLSGQQIGLTNVVCDRLTAQARRLPGALFVSNFNAMVFGGAVTGSLNIVTEKTDDVFELTADAHDIAMDALIKNFNKSTTNQYEGTLNAAVNVTGHFPDSPNWTNLSGSASVQIQNGRLMRIPLFGGLSSLLSKIYPGLGFSEQNLLTADAAIVNGLLRTDNLKLSGRVVSLAASGSYSIADGLNFKVMVHPFRDGSIASALRVVTIPISLLLEFKVSGPLQNPSWGAANLPL